MAAGSVSQVPVTGTDLFPTIADMVQVQAELSPLIEGASLRSLLSNEGTGSLARRFDSLVWHFPHYQVQKGTTPMSSIRAGNWKLVKLYETGETFLYDLSADIGETKDRSADKPEMARELAAQLDNYLAEVDAPMARHSK